MGDAVTDAAVKTHWTTVRTGKKLERAATRTGEAIKVRRMISMSPTSPAQPVNNRPRPRQPSEKSMHLWRPDTLSLAQVKAEYVGKVTVKKATEVGVTIKESTEHLGDTLYDAAVDAINATEYAAEVVVGATQDAALDARDIVLVRRCLSSHLALRLPCANLLHAGRGRECDSCIIESHSTSHGASHRISRTIWV